jgi:hypothetical protein
MPREDILWDILWTWETTKDGRILRQVCGQEIIIDQILIHEQLGISKERVVDVANVTFEEAKTSKRIARPLFSTENEQWNVVRMKEEFPTIFVAILQILF